jgi:hypothetical protein
MVDGWLYLYCTEQLTVPLGRFEADDKIVASDVYLGLSGPGFQLAIVLSGYPSPRCWPRVQGW